MYGPFKDKKVEAYLNKWCDAYPCLFGLGLFVFILGSVYTFAGLFFYVLDKAGLLKKWDDSFPG